MLRVTKAVNSMYRKLIQLTGKKAKSENARSLIKSKAYREIKRAGKKF